MKQAKFTINEAQDKFISNYDELGLKDKSAVVRQALDCLMERIENERMRQGVDLYAEIYEQDKDLQDLTRASMEEWKNGGTGSRDDNTS
jgi:hypothetical protein